MKLKTLAKQLDDIRQHDGTDHFWLASHLYGYLGYNSLKSFQPAIKRARISCRTSGQDVDLHFARVQKSGNRSGWGRTRVEPADYKLSCYACYLVALNGDVEIPEIAFLQMYFLLQTRKQEVGEDIINEIERLISREKLTETEKEFSSVIYQRGVDRLGIGEIKSEGDRALFGGYSTQDMKRLLKIKDLDRPLPDVLPKVTIDAKNFATAMTTHNTVHKRLHGKLPIKREHVENNESVRNTLLSRGIQPENLPAEEDVRLVRSRLRKTLAVARSKEALKSLGDF